MRRLFLLAILSLIIWGVVAFFGWVGSLFAPASASKSNLAECAPGTVAVSALVGDGNKEVLSFQADQNPMITFTLTNTGTVACKFNGGPRVTFFTIKSDQEKIWSSRQCDRTGLVDKWVDLAPGKTMIWAADYWYRVHSSDSGCGEGQLPVLPGAYSLTAEVNGVISGNYEQFILN